MMASVKVEPRLAEARSEELHAAGTGLSSGNRLFKHTTHLVEGFALGLVNGSLGKRPVFTKGIPFDDQE